MTNQLPQWMVLFRDLSDSVANLDSEILPTKELKRFHKQLLKISGEIKDYLTDKNGETVEEKLLESKPVIDDWMQGFQQFSKEVDAKRLSKIFSWVLQVLED